MVFENIAVSNRHSSVSQKSPESPTSRVIGKTKPFTAKDAEDATEIGAVDGTNPRRIGIPWDE
jgi:hypothetical protein